VRVTLCDVGPRDGLQNEPETLEPAVRAELVRRLAAAGLPRVEAASFVNPERVAIADRPAAATISVAFGCPFAGEVDPGVVADLAERLVTAGAGVVVLAYTIGVATPRPVAQLVERTLVLGVPVGGHFHDTRHTGVACAWAAVEA
jgi:isopropylmalate/homocitrate/citramalate synthase